MLGPRATCIFILFFATHRPYRLALSLCLKTSRRFSESDLVKFRYRRRNPSSDRSDGELLPLSDFVTFKTRSEISYVFHTYTYTDFGGAYTYETHLTDLPKLRQRI